VFIGCEPWKDWKKMIIVRNCKGKTFEEAISRRKTGNTLVLGQKKNDKKCSTKHFIETKDRAMWIPLNTCGDLWSSGRVSMFSSSGTRRVRNTNTKRCIIDYFDTYIQASTEEVRAFMTKLLHRLKWRTHIENGNIIACLIRNRFQI
jgi:hypothetical protein